MRYAADHADSWWAFYEEDTHRTELDSIPATQNQIAKMKRLELVITPNLTMRAAKMFISAELKARREREEAQRTVHRRTAHRLKVGMSRDAPIGPGGRKKRLTSKAG